MSGQHVLFGHLSQLARWTLRQHEFLILHHAAHTCLVREALPFANVSFLQAPQIANHWATRSAWESVTIPSLIRRHAVDRYFTPAGTILPRCPVPQISLAQNPWCLVPQIHRSFSERAKASLQRGAYRSAATNADLMVYNSHHIRSLYSKNADNARLTSSVIAFQGINDETHMLAKQQRNKVPRSPLSVVSVSAMAHWKGAETVVSAIGMLRERGIEANLTLVGPWPDAMYEKSVRSSIAEKKLQNAVTITGKVSVSELHNHYATAKVFCLMSRCESFGIPAVEAQAFGTPVVGSSSTAMAEIGGDGGVFGPPENAATTADMLQSVLTDNTTWSKLSAAAITNSSKYRWETCSVPLMSIFGPGLSADKTLATNTTIGSPA
jgi:glycosyltransferase involved in cell wall biosynthesis